MLQRGGAPQVDSQCGSLSFWFIFMNRSPTGWFRDTAPSSTGPTQDPFLRKVCHTPPCPQDQTSRNSVPRYLRFPNLGKKLQNKKGTENHDSQTFAAVFLQPCTPARWLTARDTNISTQKPSPIPPSCCSDNSQAQVPQDPADTGEQKWVSVKGLHSSHT